jgi:hypothetical protein
MKLPTPTPKRTEWRTILEMLDPSKIGMLGRFDRIGVRSFVTILEYQHFTPDTPMSKLYQLPVLHRAGVLWFLVIIPQMHLDLADAVAKQVGLYRVQGEPAEFANDGGERFPCDLTNIWTLINVPGHFADDCAPDVQAAAYAAEDQTVERIANEHYLRVMLERGRGGRSQPIELTAS